MYIIFVIIFLHNFTATLSDSLGISAATHEKKEPAFSESPENIANEE